MPGSTWPRSAWELADEEGRAVTTDEVIKGVAAVIEYFIAQNEAAGSLPPVTVFDGPLPILDDSAHGLLSLIVNSGLCSKECFIMSLVYVERILQRDPCFKITRRNFHRLIVASVLVGSKVLDDFYCRNVYYAVAAGLSKAELNRLELTMCDLLDFDLHVQPAEFALYRDSLIRKTGESAPAVAKVAATIPTAMMTLPDFNLSAPMTMTAPMMPMPVSGSPTARSWTDVVKAKTPERAEHGLLHQQGLPVPTLPPATTPAPVQQLFARSAFETTWKEAPRIQSTPMIRTAIYQPRAAATPALQQYQQYRLHAPAAAATTYQQQATERYLPPRYPTQMVQDSLGVSNAWFGFGTGKNPVLQRMVPAPVQHFAASQTYDRRLPALQAM